MALKRNSHRGGTQRSSPVVYARRAEPKPSNIFREAFWRFAGERQRVFFGRLQGQAAPWTSDPILQHYRFTNAYRASDRVSQFLIRHVIYRDDLPSDPHEVVFRILLFKIFNKIETWLALEEALGAIAASSFDAALYRNVLDEYRKTGTTIYSSAYIMPSTGILGHNVKHHGHLRLLEMVLDDTRMQSICESQSLQDLFAQLHSLPTIGNFLAFQYAIDLNYSEHFGFSEMDFVVAGPGARDGLAKCFDDFGDYTEEEVIRWVTDHQPENEDTFIPLYGRPLQLIDVQNLFCEISKYTRVSHPDTIGVNGRTKIKQRFQARPEPIRLFYPPDWGINDRMPNGTTASPGIGAGSSSGISNGLRFVSGSGGTHTPDPHRPARIDRGFAARACGGNR